MFNLLFGWLFMAAFYVVYMRGYSTQDPLRATRVQFRQQVGGRFGLLPPSREPVGVLLWVLTALGCVAAIAFFLVGDRFIGASSGTMVGTFLLTLWRDDQWIKQQPGYQAAVEALEAAKTGRRDRSTGIGDDED